MHNLQTLPSPICFHRP